MATYPHFQSFTIFRAMVPVLRIVSRAQGPCPLGYKDKSEGHHGDLERARPAQGGTCYGPVSWGGQVLCHSSFSLPWAGRGGGEPSRGPQPHSWSPSREYTLQNVASLLSSLVWSPPGPQGPPPPTFIALFQPHPVSQSKFIGVTRAAGMWFYFTSGLSFKLPLGEKFRVLVLLSELTCGCRVAIITEYQVRRERGRGGWAEEGF